VNQERDRQPSPAGFVAAAENFRRPTATAPGAVKVAERLSSQCPALEKTCVAALRRPTHSILKRRAGRDALLDLHEERVKPKAPSNFTLLEFHPRPSPGAAAPEVSAVVRILMSRVGSGMVRVGGLRFSGHSRSDSGHFRMQRGVQII
jgi:hypothetical protein